MRSNRHMAIGILVMAVNAIMLAQPAQAHEQRTVGKVRMTVGWSIEPAYPGFQNSVQLFLKDASGKPILDIGDGLKVEITFGKQKTALFPLDPSFDPDTGLGNKGEFDAPIIPTRPGNYTFHFVGTVRGERIDQSFTSSDKTFDPVTDAAAVEFPAKDPSVGELAGRIERIGPRIDAARSAAGEAGNAAAQSKTFGIAGIVIGAVGVILGLTRGRR